jgi:hypothetical protein
MLDIVILYLSLFEPSKKLSINNCFFTLSDLLDAVETIGKGEIVMLDEQVHTTGYGSMIERKTLENVEMTVRSHRLSLFFAAPKFIQHNFHYYIETWQMGADKKWDWTRSIHSQWKYTKNIVFSDKGHMLGYVVTMTPPNALLLRQYEAKKDEFIVDVRQMRGGGRYKRVLKKCEFILNDTEFLKKYVFCKSKRLKQLLVNEYLKGPWFSIEEWRTLIDKLDYEIIFNDKFSELRALPRRHQQRQKASDKADDEGADEDDNEARAD